MENIGDMGYSPHQSNVLPKLAQLHENPFIHDFSYMSFVSRAQI